MRLSVNSGFYSVRPGDIRFSVFETLDFCKRIGFSVIDFGLHGSIFTGEHNEETFLHGDNWEKNVEQIVLYGKKLGLDFAQSHLPFYVYTDPDIKDREFKEEMVRRSIMASAMLGVKWAVFHPSNVPSTDLVTSKKAVSEYLIPHITHATRLGVGIAIENTLSVGFTEEKHRYCSTAEELCDLTDTLKTGICWDTGHSNITGRDQVKELRTVGNRLKVLHINDNFGQSDAHTAPFIGKVKWRKIMETLDEIGYEGDFNFEVSVAGIPVELREEHAKYLIATGRYLLGIKDSIK
ncbi:MAG: sugar phosphate isomerase/epimerase [Elusimicrobiota bacterium]